ncbi:cag pathogenicity island protein Cag4 [Devosia geojensis]|uniref:Cag pathogenicity island protein Cag4 n=1 Tax=Devosia geojensis TaxID=443610 RepID=A0A0F5FT63_9HYPH|nr:nuclear transport factor 2 family protein [Devosia geojensis]KKB12046.1 cag pathogenicity island protein Cag4 [Devosia geojensis]
MTPEDVLAQYEARINRHDFDELVPLISGEAVFWFNDGSLSGLAEIRQAFEATWERFPLEDYWLTDKRWIAHGEGAAACLYRFNWKAEVDGKPLSGAGRGTTVLRREAEEWKIVHEHLSGLPG